MTPTAEQLEAWDRRHYWHGFTQMAEYEPLVIERAQGCRLIDVRGRSYLDGVSSIWCNVHGHRHPYIDQAVRDQLDRVAHNTSLGMSNATTVALAKRLADIAPGDLNHVFFASDGSAAVEAGLKIAFQYWHQCEPPQPGKTRFVALGGAYHGDTLGSVSVGRVPAFHQVYDPLLFPVLRLPSPEMYRLPEDVRPEEACDHYLSQAEALLSAEHEQIAAVVIEPRVQGAAGMILQPSGYVRGMRELTRQYNVLLIADEVAVGLGRTGTMFACEQEDVVPDLLCLGKGLSGGYLPLAVTLASEQVYRAFLGRYEQARTFFHGHTYGGNPLAAAAAHATLDLFEHEQTLARLPAKMARIAEHLTRIGRHPHVGDTRQCGMMVGIELVRNKETAEAYAWQEKRGYRACEHALERGVWLRPLGNVVIIVPPLVIETDDLDAIFHAAEEGIVVATRD